MFAALDESITEARLALAQKIYAVLWIILTIPLAVYFIMDKAWHDTIYASLANYCASALVLFSVIFFQFQAFYLVYVIYSSKRNKKDSNVVKYITSTVLINLATALLDWIALGVQFYQLSAFSDKNFFWNCNYFAQVLMLHYMGTVQYRIEMKNSPLNNAKDFIRKWRDKQFSDCESVGEYLVNISTKPDSAVLKTRNKADYENFKMGHALSGAQVHLKEQLIKIHGQAKQLAEQAKVLKAQLSKSL
jgi:hypothetical protein